MIARWLVFGSAGLAALGVAAACTTFGTDDGAAPDASTDAANETGPVAPALCVPPAPSLEPVTTCTDCTPVPLFLGKACDAVIVGDGQLYAMSGGVLHRTTNIEASPLEPVNASTMLAGVFLGMGIDAQNVYVTTDITLHRIARSSGAATAGLPPGFEAPLASPVLYGKTVVVQRQAMRVLSAPLSGDGGTGDSQTVNPTSGIANDGDTAYWLGQSSAGAAVMLGPFPKTDEQIALPRPVVGFAVAGDLAFLAEEDAASGTTTISRIALKRGGGGSRAVLAIEQGKVESVHAHDGQVYWVVRRRQDAGIRALIGIDACGGVPVMRATELPAVRNGLSFSGNWAYFVSTVQPSGPIYRMKIK